MTRKEQDKRWNELSEEKQLFIKQLYEAYSEGDLGAEKYFEELFGKHNLQPKLTYEDVAKELFKDGAWQLRTAYFINGDNNSDFNDDANPTFPLNLSCQKQANKLLAINKLLNVAKNLNKNEDGTDWVPDRQDGMWTIGVDRYDGTVIPVETGMYDYGTEIVYFRTEALAKQAIEILGEELILTALGNY